MLRQHTPSASNRTIPLRRRYFYLLVVVCFALAVSLHSFHLQIPQPAHNPPRYALYTDHVLDRAAAARGEDEVVRHARHGTTLASQKTTTGRKPERAYLHLLVPARSANENLCKMLLSITALGYPAPIFLNWGDDEGEADYPAQKVAGTLRYLRGLPKTRENDVVLIVDGFDSWFQLRPGLLIERYYAVIAADAARVRKMYGAEVAHDHHLTSSIIFAADQECLPAGQDRAACWAVPDSPLPRFAYGPDTDSGDFLVHNRPRWLNSGTIMGPVRDLKRLFEETVERTQRTTDVTSLHDQLHFGDIFGRQEYARRLLLKGSLDSLVTNTTEIPIIDPRQDPNFHLTLDYEGLLFQLVSHSWKYLGWYSYDNSTYAGQLTTGDDATLPDNAFTRATRFSLPVDVAASQAPLDGIHPDIHPTTIGDDPSRDPHYSGVEVPARLSWDEVMLGTNVITGSAFAIIHHNAKREYIESWWNNMWFFKYGESILRNAPATATATSPLVVTPDGKSWWPWVTDDNDDIAPEHRVGGGFEDRGSWHSWHRLCASYEQVVFKNMRIPE